MLTNLIFFMKIKFLAIIAWGFLTCNSVVTGVIHHGWADRYRNMIAEAKQNPSKENVSIVINELPVCFRYMNHQDETNVAMYLELKKGALELPNHLEYLTEKIETERAKVADHSYHSGTRNSFNGLRVGIIRDTLCHLPSPATVRLLGHYLSDERDTPPPPFPGQDWGDSESNAYQACTALEQIGLRNAPVKARFVQNESNLATWRLWRGQVEAGTRAFSFEGEEVEYRFCKDGTWEQSAISNTTRKTSDSSSAITTHSVWSSYQARWACVVAGISIGWLFLQWSKRRRLAV